jgi:hypothetical protein
MLVSAMAEYRLYCLDEADRFTKAHEINASSDEEAIEQARALKLPVECELWERGRKVAVLDAVLS